jgi:hypothetical protein
VSDYVPTSQTRGVHLIPKSAGLACNLNVSARAILPRLQAFFFNKHVMEWKEEAVEMIDQYSKHQRSNNNGS